MKIPNAIRRIARAQAINISGIPRRFKLSMNNLDSKNSAIVHETFLKLKNDFNQTLLIVTHNKDLVELADTIFEMKDGKLV